MAEGGGSEWPPHFKEPEARYHACAAAIGKEVFMYRGYLQSFRRKLKVSPPSRCEVFDTTVFQWDKRYTDGPNPKAWQSSSIAVFQHRLFFYGGWNGRDYTNELFELDTLTSPMKWMQHKPKNPKKGPRKKEGCGFIALPGGEELCVLAGYGIPVGRDPPGTTTIKDKRYRDGRGWTNELHCYHRAEATWRSPEQTGQRPPPGVAMTFTRVDARRVVVFAGNNKAAQRRVHDVHILDITIWHWSGVILPQGIRQPWPEGRWYHTAYSLWDPDSNPQNPSLVVTGGLSEDAQTLGDLWVFEVNGLTWEELELPDSIVRRMNHSGGLVHASDTTRLLVTNGGIPEDTNLYKSESDYCIISETVITELVYNEEAAASGSCGWSVAAVMRNGSKVTRDGSKVTKEQEAAVSQPGKGRPEHDENPMDRKLNLEFDVMELLGKGGFGVVYRVKSKLDNGEYALKIIKLPASKRQENEVKHEVDVLMGLDHSRILRYFQSWPARILDPVILKSFEIKEDPLACAELSHYNLSAGGSGVQATGDSSREDSQGADEQPRSKYPLCLFIQTQLCRKDTLKDWLLKNMHNRPKDVVFDYFGQILEAVVYIHDKGLLHRDLKPSNIFFSQDGGIKVGDFGLVAGNISPEQSSREEFHSGQVGTWFYMAPEQLSGQKYDQKVDIFALGVIFLELNYPLTAKDRDQVHSDLRHKLELPKRFTEESPVEAALAKKLLNREAVKRPSAREVLEELTSLKASLSGQASSSGHSLSTSIQGASPQTLKDPVSTGREMDTTTDSGVGISQSQDSGGPSSVGGVPQETLSSVRALHQIPDISDSGIAGDSQTHSGEVHPRFQGVHFLSGSPWHVSVTSESKMVQWDEIGVLVDIPEGAVPPDKVLNLTVWPCIKGPFVPPPGYEFASPVFIVGPEFKFDEKVLLQLSHFVRLQSSDDCEKMVFLSARSTSQSTKDGKLGYRFKVLEGGSFEVGQSVGTITLSHFCAVAVGKEINAGGKVHYSLQFHHSEEARKAFFVVSIVNEVYKKRLGDFLKEGYPHATFQRAIKQPVEFAGDEVTLRVPNPTDSTMSGWVIVSDITPCKIFRKEVDFPLAHSDTLPDYPPKLSLTLEQSRPPQSPFRQCSLSVVGLTEPWSFTLVLHKSPPSAPLPLSQQPTRVPTTEPWSPVTPLSPPATPAATNGNLGDDPLLGQGDLIIITDYLQTLVEKRDIRSLGLVLGLHHDRLKVLEQTSDSYLDDVIAAWLRREGDVDKRGGPRWSTLVKALQHHRLKQSGIAKDIAKARGLPFTDQ